MNGSVVSLLVPLSLHPFKRMIVRSVERLIASSIARLYVLVLPRFSEPVVRLRPPESLGRLDGRVSAENGSSQIAPWVLVSFVALRFWVLWRAGYLRKS